MIGSLEHPPIVIRSSRGKTLLLLLGSAAFVAAGAWAVSDGSGQQDWRGWLAIVFFGLCAIAALWRLIRPETLTIAREGFHYTAPMGSTAFSWTEIERFRFKGWAWATTIGRPTLDSPTVWIEFSIKNKPLDRLQALSSAGSGTARQMPGGWEVDAEPLCELLSQALERWGRGN